VVVEHVKAQAQTPLMLRAVKAATEEEVINITVLAVAVVALAVTAVMGITQAITLPVQKAVMEAQELVCLVQCAEVAEAAPANMFQALRLPAALEVVALAAIETPSETVLEGRPELTGSVEAVAVSQLLQAQMYILLAAAPVSSLFVTPLLTFRPTPSALDSLTRR